MPTIAITSVWQCEYKHIESMDPNTIKVKAEGGVGAPSGAAGKPKFVPKAPVKKESKPETTAPRLVF